MSFMQLVTSPLSTRTTRSTPALAVPAGANSPDVDARATATFLVCPLFVTGRVVGMLTRALTDARSARRGAGSSGRSAASAGEHSEKTLVPAESGYAAAAEIAGAQP